MMPRLLVKNCPAFQAKHNLYFLFFSNKSIEKTWNCFTLAKFWEAVFSFLPTTDDCNATSILIQLKMANLDQKRVEIDSILLLVEFERILKISSQRGATVDTCLLEGAIKEFQSFGITFFVRKCTFCQQIYLDKIGLLIYFLSCMSKQTVAPKLKNSSITPPNVYIRAVLKSGSCAKESH